MRTVALIALCECIVMAATGDDGNDEDLSFLQAFVPETSASQHGPSGVSDIAIDDGSVEDNSWLESFLAPGASSSQHAPDVEFTTNESTVQDFSFLECFALPEASASQSETEQFALVPADVSNAAHRRRLAGLALILENVPRTAAEVIRALRRLEPPLSTTQIGMALLTAAGLSADHRSKSGCIVFQPVFF